MKNLLFVSYYTDGYYEGIINKYLLPSLQKFNLSYYIEKKPNLHDWIKNGKYKTQFIFDMLLKNDNDMIFLDADAELLKFPELFFNLNNTDIGIHYLDWWLFWHNQANKNKRELLTGTMFFKNNEIIRELVREWNEFNQSTRELAQKTLPIFLNKQIINIYELPIKYCQIIKSDNIIPNNTVIAQHQASRQIKNNQEIL
jgi:hypothetical protein